MEQARPGNEEAARAIASLSVEKTIVEGKYAEDVAPSKVAGRAGSRPDAAELTPEQRLERDIRRNPKDLSKYIELSELYIREEVFSKAVEVLARAVEVSGGDLDMRERLENVQMRHCASSWPRRRSSTQQTGREDDKRRYEDTKRLVFEKDLETCKSRVDRYPNNLAYKLSWGTAIRERGNTMRPSRSSSSRRTIRAARGCAFSAWPSASGTSRSIRSP